MYPCDREKWIAIVTSSLGELADGSAFLVGSWMIANHRVADARPFFDDIHLGGGHMPHFLVSGEFHCHWPMVVFLVILTTRRLTLISLVMVELVLV